MAKRKKKELTPEEIENNNVKTFLDMNMPNHVRFFNDYLVQDNSYRTVWVIRSYPTQTKDLALLSELGEKAGVTLHVISKEMDASKEQKIIQEATNANLATVFSGGSNQERQIASEEVGTVNDLIRQLHRDKESLFDTTVFIEMHAESLEDLNILKADCEAILKRLRIAVDKLFLQQKEGFLSVAPGGVDQFNGRYSRALPGSSVSNLYPFSYSGRSDPKGISLGYELSGGQMIVDMFGYRSATITNSNVVVLGQTGMGKSHTLKGLIIAAQEQGFNCLIMDIEGEYEPEVRNLQGTYIDLTSGQYIINILEPKVFVRDDDDVSASTEYKTKTFTTTNTLSAHISFLRDFFSIAKDMTPEQLDTLEIILRKLYTKFGLTDETDFASLPKSAFPTLTDLWELLEELAKEYKEDKDSLFNFETLRSLRLKLESLCVGTQSKYFNGHTNIVSDHLLAFGLKNLTSLDKNTRGAILFNCLSYMTDMMLSQGETVGFIDELHMFLGTQMNSTAANPCEYISSLSRRCRKYNSALVLSTQQIVELLQSENVEYTKPLLMNACHKILLSPGTVDDKEYCNALNIDEAEFNLIRLAKRGRALYCCGNSRYSIQISFPKWKTDLFGDLGGR